MNQSDRIKVLFFSRGRGRGHAVPDLAIAEEIPSLQANIVLQFASYATGAEVLRQAGWPVVDLGLPETNPYTRTLLAAHQLITQLQPDIVISHEEFAALPAAHLAGTPSVLLTDWFPTATQATGEAIAYADAIVFFGEAGLFPLPASVRRPPVHIRPIIRKMKYCLADRPRARAELDISDRTFVVSVIPGAWATEEKAPIAPIVLPAFKQLEKEDKILFWLTKSDRPQLEKMAQDMPQLRVLADHPVVEQLMVASDLIITKGNRGTIMDAANLGVRSLSLSPGTNFVDDILVPRIPSNTAFNARAMDAALLRGHLERCALTSFPNGHPPPQAWPQGGEEAARTLLVEINRLLSAASVTGKS